LRNVSCRNAAVPHIARESQPPIGFGPGAADPAKPSGGRAPVPTRTERAQAGEETGVIAVGHPALLPDDASTCGYKDPAKTYTVAPRGHSLAAERGGTPQPDHQERHRLLR
ncbi:hypothetical protein, partial [Streptomyces sp.]|uniref:hypothetical protein n=1 Tax=Streptomyces sp. TaxID=1931 RepID=UPI00281163B3